MNVVLLQFSEIELVEIYKETKVAQITETANVQIYPNPTSNKLTINLKGMDAQKVSIVSLSGQTVMVVGKEQLKSNTVNLNVSGLAKGLYIIQIDGNNTSASKKLLIK